MDEKAVKREAEARDVKRQEAEEWDDSPRVSEREEIEGEERFWRQREDVNEIRGFCDDPPEPWEP